LSTQLPPHLSEGRWSLSSKSDPRWNCEGIDFLTRSGTTTDECENRKRELQDLYGEPPEDLCFQFER